MELLYPVAGKGFRRRSPDLPKRMEDGWIRPRQKPTETMEKLETFGDYVFGKLCGCGSAVLLEERALEGTSI